MSTDDPERLLAEALRAQATRAPADTSQVGYGLLSGSEFGAITPPAPASESTTRLDDPAKQIPAWLILLLSLVLGLAAGAVVGLVTLL
ncbi:hypothetical protein [Actinophytocola glycyrrhizae]|uniref:Uncharacterized protein n=1 Tax=Actinophytocola glycyrrhizae TaxID=2044873 RepID=A0ABV9SDC5_9PSEU